MPGNRGDRGRIVAANWWRFLTAGRWFLLSATVFEAATVAAGRKSQGTHGIRHVTCGKQKEAQVLVANVVQPSCCTLSLFFLRSPSLCVQKASTEGFPRSRNAQVCCPIIIIKKDAAALATSFMARNNCIQSNFFSGKNDRGWDLTGRRDAVHVHSLLSHLRWWPIGKWEMRISSHASVWFLNIHILTLNGRFSG